MNAPTKQQHAQSFDFWIVIVISIFWRTCTEKYEIKNIKFDKTSQHSTPKKINPQCRSSISSQYSICI